MVTNRTKIDIRDIVHDGVRPDRAADNLRVSHSANGGFTTYRKKRVVSVQAPMTNSAEARTIRIHEMFMRIVRRLLLVANGIRLPPMR